MTLEIIVFALAICIASLVLWLAMENETLKVRAERRYREGYEHAKKLYEPQEWTREESPEYIALMRKQGQWVCKCGSIEKTRAALREHRVRYHGNPPRVGKKTRKAVARNRSKR